MSGKAEKPFVTHVDAQERSEHDDETGGLVRILRADDLMQVGLWKLEEYPP